MPEDTTNPENLTPGRTPTLEEVRDEKCLPIAQSILEILPETLLPEDGISIDHKPLVLAILRKSLEADLAVDSEAPYLAQLLLGAMSGLNATVQVCDTVPLDDVRYASIGKKILAMVAEARVRMTNVKPEDMVADFAPVKEKLNALFAEEQLNRLEVKYITTNILESFSSANSIFGMSLEKTVRRAEAKVFGIEDMSELTMRKLDGFLTAE